MWHTRNLNEPRMLVLGPPVLLTIVFAIIAIFIMSGDAISLGLDSWLIVAGIGIYAATMTWMVRFGLSQITRLERLGLTDSLSQLPNRHALHARFKHRIKTGEPFAIALVQLDGFKQANDTYGHNVGDKLIKKCALQLQKMCGNDARCYRVGGGQFAINVVGSLASNILESICHQLLENFNTLVIIDDRKIPVNISIGLSSSDGQDQLSSKELMRRSNIAMYASKRSGTGHCTWYKREFDQNYETICAMDNDLRLAMANEEFDLVYQPLVNSCCGDIVAVESLIRWRRPNGEVIAPDIFIPVAEKSGLIGPLTLWTLRRACQDAKNWDRITLSVNISAIQLRDPEFPLQLAQILDETRFPAERLELEITETSLVFDPEIAKSSLDMLRSVGVTIVLDDFGSGYASIGFLRQFHFGKLKLDRSLVANAGHEEDARAILLSTVTIARALNMAVTAEGVETEQQAEIVRAAGCDQIQGWLYFKAMPTADVTALLEQTSRKANASDLKSAKGAA